MPDVLSCHSNTFPPGLADAARTIIFPSTPLPDFAANCTIVSPPLVFPETAALADNVNEFPAPLPGVVAMIEFAPIIIAVGVHNPVLLAHTNG
jgi:hypothetical protein